MQTLDTLEGSVDPLAAEDALWQQAREALRQANAVETHLGQDVRFSDLLQSQVTRDQLGW